MVKILTLDSSVIVTALREQEERHKECIVLLERVKNGEFIAVEPYTVLVEVVAAIKRRTGSKELAEQVKKDLQKIGSIYFLELESNRANESADIAKKADVKGMDAVVIQIAREFDATLISLDKEMVKKAKSYVKQRDIKKL